MVTRTIRASRAERGPSRSRPRLALAHVGCSDRAAEDTARLIWLDGVDEVAIGRGDELVVHGGAGRIEIAAPDPRMSSRHARLVREDGAWLLEDVGSTNGTFVGGERVARRALAPADVLETGHTFWRLVESAGGGSVVGPTSAAIGPTRTISPALIEQIGLVDRIARGKLSVLVMGETGTGKEVVARHLHAQSGRSGDLRAINCAAIPGSLLEGELFGHRRGAFTGAAEERAGLVEAADRGTLLLDEIGDLPAEAQAKLLRVLQEGEVVRLGDTRPRKVDVRFVAATNRELRQLVRAGRFREDLYARLAGFTVRLPPLRARIEDLGILVAHLLRRFAGAEAPRVRLRVEVLRALLAHPWPFNVRELERTIDALLLLAYDVAEISLEHLRLAMVETKPADDRAPPVARVATRVPDDALRARIEELLSEHGGNISAVARAMGKSRIQIHRWLRKLEIAQP